jgi:hypothetical protein
MTQNILSGHGAREPDCGKNSLPSASRSVIWAQSEAARSVLGSEA